MDEVQKVLTRTKELLVRFGWRKYSDGNEHSGYCLLGALGRACDEISAKIPFCHIFNDGKIRLKKAIYSKDEVLLGDWNDDPTTTKDMVLEAIDKALALPATP